MATADPSQADSDDVYCDTFDELQLPSSRGRCSTRNGS